MSKKVVVVNKATGEIYEWSTSNDLKLAESYKQISEMIQALERAKKKIRDQVLVKLDNAPNDSIEVGDYKWNKIIMHRKNYNIEVMQHELPPDIYDALVKPNKVAIDDWLKEVVEMGEDSPIEQEVVKILRDTMYDERPPTVAVKLERLKDDLRSS